MKKSKRVIALIMSLMLCVSIFPAAAFAAEAGEITVDFSEAVEEASAEEPAPGEAALEETAPAEETETGRLPGEEATVTEDAALTRTGPCGSDLIWTLDDDGTLTISGTGTMGDYSSDNTPWNAYKASVKKVIVEAGVTNVSSYAFSACQNLTSVELPFGMTGIGNYAFYGCAGLTGVELPDGLTGIGRFAFCKCTGLTGLELPDGVASVGDYAFQNCTGLKSVVFPASLESVGSSAFYGCSSLKTVTFSGNAPEFGSAVFYGDTLTAYYPADNTTWTADVLQNYSGKVTWTAYCSHSQVVILPGVDPTCTETGLTEGLYCKACGTVLDAQEVILALGHALTHTDAAASTCTEPGHNEYWTCSRCGLMFSDKAGTSETTKESVVLPAPGHKAVTDAAVAPTCTGTGLTEGSHCSRCGAVLTEQKTVAALGHDYQAASKTEPTCTEEGYTTYTCSRCKDSYAADEVSALGHSYDADHPVYNWSDDGKTCTVSFSCVRGDDTKTVTGKVYSTVTQAATCAKAGVTEYMVIAIYQGRQYTDTIALADLPVLPHTPTDAGTVTVPTCTEQGYTTFICSVCGQTYREDFTDALGHYVITDPAVAADCTKTGLTKGSHCGRCGEVFVKQEVTPALGHLYETDPVYNWSEDGKTCTLEFACSRGDHTEKVAGKVYSAVDQAATCTEPGVTDYVVRASFNGQSYMSSTTRSDIPALGHDWGEWILDAETGTWVRCCTRCTEVDIGIKAGDCDNNDVVDALDLAALKSALAADDFSMLCRGADVNGDNSINLMDLLVLKNLLAEK